MSMRLMGKLMVTPHRFMHITREVCELLQIIIVSCPLWLRCCFFNNYHVLAYEIIFVADCRLWFKNSPGYIISLEIVDTKHNHTTP